MLHHHHHHHRPSLLLEHRPPTMVRQRALSWAALSISLQVWPVFVNSASKSRRQVFLGLPLFRFPCGFHFSACLVMLFAGFLRVCPIHPHLLRRISSSTGIWLVCCIMHSHYFGVSYDMPSFTKLLRLHYLYST